MENLTVAAPSDSQRVKWTFLIALLLSVVLAIASYRLLPDSNLPIALAAIAGLLSLVELVCEVQEKRIRLITSRALIVKSIRILITITPLLVLRLLAPHALQLNPSTAENSQLVMNPRGTPANVSEARMIKLETTDARLERRLSALERGTASRQPTAVPR